MNVLTSVVLIAAHHHRTQQIGEVGGPLVVWGGGGALAFGQLSTRDLVSAARAVGFVGVAKAITLNTSAAPPVHRFSSGVVHLSNARNEQYAIHDHHHRCAL